MGQNICSQKICPSAHAPISQGPTRRSGWGSIFLCFSPIFEFSSKILSILSMDNSVKFFFKQAKTGSKTLGGLEGGGGVCIRTAPPPPPWACPCRRSRGLTALAATTCWSGAGALGQSGKEAPPWGRSKYFNRHSGQSTPFTVSGHQGTCLLSPATTLAFTPKIGQLVNNQPFVRRYGWPSVGPCTRSEGMGFCSKKEPNRNPPLQRHHSPT